MIAPRGGVPLIFYPKYRYLGSIWKEKNVKIHPVPFQTRIIWLKHKKHTYFFSGTVPLMILFTNETYIHFPRISLFSSKIYNNTYEEIFFSTTTTPVSQSNGWKWWGKGKLSWRKVQDIVGWSWLAAAKLNNLMSDNNVDWQLDGN